MSVSPPVLPRTELLLDHLVTRCFSFEPWVIDPGCCSPLFNLERSRHTLVQFLPSETIGHRHVGCSSSFDLDKEFTRILGVPSLGTRVVCLGACSSLSYFGREEIPGVECRPSKTLTTYSDICFSTRLRVRDDVHQSKYLFERNVDPEPSLRSSVRSAQEGASLEELPRFSILPPG